MLLNELDKNANQPVMYIAIGPSGSGKSTIFKKLLEKNPNLRSYSWDALRHEFYDPVDYANAYKQSNEDPSFNSKITNRFHEMVNAPQDIFIDNVNLTPKRRKQFIEAGKRNGYEIVAITFNVDLQTILDRQHTRGDKKVPAGAVTQQYNSMIPPRSDEGFDKIISADNI